MTGFVGDPEARLVEAELDLDAWNGFRVLPPDQQVADGVTASEMSSLFGRPQTPPGARYRSRVVYGTAGSGGRDLHLYLYARADTRDPRPGVLFIHGGGWRELGPFVHIRTCADLAEQGFVTATLHYRLAGEALWPAALEDCKAAIRWMRANAAEIGLDPARIAVSGSSAGGHLAAMVALTPGRFEGAGGNAGVSSRPQAAVMVSPAVDILHPANPGHLREGFGAFVGSDEEASIRAANPPTYLDRNCPPMLALTGDADEVTPLEMVADFNKQLDALGVRNQLVVYPGGGHGFELYPGIRESCIQRMVDFLLVSLPATPAAGVSAG
jgi:acetyl esterase/lipase